MGFGITLSSLKTTGRRSELERGVSGVALDAAGMPQELGVRKYQGLLHNYVHLIVRGYGAEIRFVML